MLRIISFTLQGDRLAAKIAGACPARVFTKHQVSEDGMSEAKPEGLGEQVTCSLAEWAAEGFQAGDPLLFIGAAGIAVRAVAPSVRDKLTDVPVLVMDPAGQFVIPILSGHYGGANRLAEELSGVIGATPVITTATDCIGAFAADVFARDMDLLIRNPGVLPGISGRAVAGEILRISVEESEIFRLTEEDRARYGITEEEKIRYGIAEGEKEKYGIPTGERARVRMVRPEEPADIRILCRPLTEHEAEDRKVLYLTPQRIFAGIGCRKGTDPEKLESFVREKMNNLGLDIRTIRTLASIDRKKEEPAILLLAEKLGVPFVTFSAEKLREVQGDFSVSAFVEEQVGVGNVSERAAAGAAGENYRMITEKLCGEGMTLALAVDTGFSPNR